MWHEQTGETNRMLREVGVGFIEASGDPSLMAASPRTRSTAESRAVEEARRFADVISSVDLRARQAGRSVPTQEEIRETTKQFWRLIDMLGSCNLAVPAGERAAHEARKILDPWFLRSRFWSRALVKPHGVAGDFRMLEWIYDLQGNPCLDPTRPVVVNLLDSLFADVQRISGVWHRRAWLRDLIVATSTELERPVRVLDVASGGSRYTRDAVAARAGCLRLAVLDEDPAAIAFVRSWLPDDARDPAGLHCAPVERLAEIVPKPAWPEGGFDLVLSSELCDYLEDGPAAALVTHMTDLTRPGGSTVLCGFSPVVRSRAAMEWISDWKMIRRDEGATRDLFPAEIRSTVRVSTSPDGGVVYAAARKR
jgi:Methyltransferase domain